MRKPISRLGTKERRKERGRREEVARDRRNTSTVSDAIVECGKRARLPLQIFLPYTYVIHMT
jgi:hypothetical protein